jgi:hypothetical protein
MTNLKPIKLATDLKKVVWNFDKELLTEKSLDNGTRMTRIG